jgi:hypothetical protein
MKARTISGRLNRSDQRLFEPHHGHDAVWGEAAGAAVVLEAFADIGFLHLLEGDGVEMGHAR